MSFSYGYHFCKDPVNPVILVSNPNPVDRVSVVNPVDAIKELQLTSVELNQQIKAVSAKL